MGFTKLYQGIVQSSIMAEDPATFKVWIAILASCGPDGIARISSTYLSAVCRLSQEQVDKSIIVLESPDPNSRSKEEDGRRIKPQDGGWYVINYKKYREFTYSDSPAAIRQRRHRKKIQQGKSVTRHTALRDVVTGHNISASDSSLSSIPIREDKSKKKRGNGVESKEFQEWWAKYPRKLGKQDARLVYAEVTITESPEDLLKALENYLLEIAHNKTEEKYIKHPATFLRSERWKDYLNWSPMKSPGPQGPDKLAGIREWGKKQGLFPEEK